jgi:hypothetical protein
MVGMVMELVKNTEKVDGCMGKSTNESEDEDGEKTHTPANLVG